MREIKFRAWYNYPFIDLKPKTPYGSGSEWFPRWQMGVVQTYYQSKNKVRISGLKRYYNKEGDYSEYKDSYDMEIGENCIVMQYTGLNDMNGKDIWEGDVIKDGGFVAGVSWSGGDYGYFPFNDEMSTADNVEVIGNIYEHSHLLNGMGKVVKE